MNETLIGPDELELAVAGLSGLVGVLLLPAIGSWLRVLLQWIESDRSGLGRQPRLSGLQLLWAMVTSFALFFFIIALTLYYASRITKIEDAQTPSNLPEIQERYKNLVKEQA